MISIVEFEPKYSRGFASLYEAMGEKFSAKLAEYWHNARKYVKVLLAVNVEGRIVGKVTLDLAYRPYAEIVNLMVHPNHHGRGVGRGLLEECIRVAEVHGFHIQYLMTGVNNIVAHRLYSRYGFIPTILPGRLDRGYNWLFRFSKKTFVAEFLDSTPFATYKASRRRTVLADRKLYKAGWKSLLSSDRLYLYFEGQPGQPPTAGTMPRISGVEILQKGLGLKISIHEESIKIGRAEPSVFQLRVANIGGREAGGWKDSSISAAWGGDWRNTC